jgi:hypothetical protein
VEPSLVILSRPFAAAAVVLLSTAAAAYQADLVPASNRVEARDLTGTISITGADGTVRVKVEDVNGAGGDSLTGRLAVQLRIRVNGLRRRVTIPVAVDGGDGEASESLGLRADDKVIVQSVRVRGPDRRTLAEAGAVTAELAAAPPAPPPAPSDCPAALDSCQTDLAICMDDLDTCEAQ